MNSKDENPESTSIPLQIDQLCNRFEAAWKSGTSLDLTSYLLEIDESSQPLALRELLRVELEMRRARGDSPTLNDYQRRFPEQAAVVSEVFQSLHRRELDTIDTPQAHLTTGFHVRCPHCHNPIELVPDANLSDVECKSCGGSFSLTGSGATASSSEVLRSIGHFELIERLGMGAFGSVWKARDTKLDRIVAIKIPRKGQLDAEETELFLREARSAAQLHHPNIVSVHEVGRDGETVYIVSDLIQGASLDKWLVEQALSGREAATICAKIADALQHAHERGVIHRDLKPQNILMDSAGEAHLTDFGLAKREAGEITMTMEGQVLGTPAYMSPEQARGESHNADPRSDVYSLGVVLFQLLTGELPFRGNVRMLLKQVLEDDAPAPRQLDNRILRDLDTICQKCLAKEPSRRYQTSRALADDLHRFLQGEVIQARPVRSVERIWRWCKRNRAVATALVIAAILLAALSWTVREQFRQQSIAQQHLQTTRGQTFNLALAQSAAVVDSQPEEANRILEDNSLCPRAFRDLSWRLLRQRTRGETVLARLATKPPSDGGAITFVDVSPLNRYCSGINDAGVATLWNTQSEEEVRSFVSQHGKLLESTFTSDDLYFIGLDEMGCLTIWDIASGELLARRLFNGADTLVRGPDSREIAVGNMTDLDLVDRKRRIFQYPNPSRKEFRPKWRVLDLTSGDVRTAPWTISYRGKGQPTATVFSPQANDVAYLSHESHGPNDKTIRVSRWSWGDNLENSRILRLDEGAFLRNAIAIADAEGPLSIGKVVYSPKVKQANGVLNLKRETIIKQSAFSPDGRTLTTLSFEGQLEMWDAHTLAKRPSWKQIARLESSIAASCFAHSWDGSMFAVGHSDGTVSLLNACCPIAEQARSHCAGFATDGKTIIRVRRPGELVYEDIDTGEEWRIWHFAEQWNIDMREATLSPNLRYLAVVGGWPARLWVFNIEHEKLLGSFDAGPLDGQPPYCYVSDGGRLALIHNSFYGDITFLSNSGKVIYRAESQTSSKWAFDDNLGTLLREAPDSIILTDIDTGKVSAEISKERFSFDNVSPFVLSPMGDIIGYRNRLYDVKQLVSGATKASVGNFSGTIQKFSPDGALVATTKSLYDLRTGREVFNLQQHKAGNFIANSPDGHRLLTEADGKDESVMLWELDPPLLPKGRSNRAGSRPSKISHETGADLFRYAHPLIPLCGKSPNGKWFAVMAVGPVTGDMFEPQTNDFLNQKRVHQSYVHLWNLESGEYSCTVSKVSEFGNLRVLRLKVSDDGASVTPEKSEPSRFRIDEPDYETRKPWPDSLHYATSLPKSGCTFFQDVDSWEREDIYKNDYEESDQVQTSPRPTDRALVLLRDSDNLELLRLTFDQSGEWIAVAPDGRYDSSNNGIVQWAWLEDAKSPVSPIRARDSDLQLPVSALREKLYKPGLLMHVLRGEDADKPIVLDAFEIRKGAGNATFYEPTPGN